MSYAKDLQHKGYGKMLIDSCYDDAVAAGMAGVAVVTSGDSFLADRDIFVKNGFITIEKAPPKFELMIKKIRKDALNPSFKGNWDSKAEKHSHGLSIYYSNQCPMVSKWVNEMIDYADTYKIPTSVFEINDHIAAQECPSPYGTFALIYNGKLLASRPVSGGSFAITMNKLLKK
ncbi:MAG: GNAT family N-acetyltransferase, partial [Bacteroidetes bacterium]|nr:GNAT family N-acetyltransferase [Bacteroidota bacterium]